MKAVLLVLLSVVVAIPTTPDDLAALRARAKSGDPAALVECASALLKTTDPQAHLAEAMTLLQRAADAGNADAMMRLARVVGEGKLMKQDNVRAFGLVKRAAELGNPDGMMLTGYFCYVGQGTAKDKAEGLRWIRQAAKSGQQPAIQWLHEHPEAGPGSASQPASRKQPDSTAAAISRSQPAMAQPSSPSLEVREFLNADALAGGRPGGEMLATKALMRMVTGPLSAEQEKAFNAQYAAAYSRPTTAAAARHRRLNNHLMDALLQREMMLRSLRERDAAMSEAKTAELLGDIAGQQEALSIAQIQAQMLEDYSHRLTALAITADEAEDADPKPEPPPEKAYQAARAAASAAIEHGLFGRWVFEKVLFTEPVLPKGHHSNVKCDENGARVIHKLQASERDVPTVCRAVIKWTKPPAEFGVYESRSVEGAIPAEAGLAYSIADDGYEPGTDVLKTRLFDLLGSGSLYRGDLLVQEFTNMSSLRHEIWMDYVKPGEPNRVEGTWRVYPPLLADETRANAIGYRRHPEQLRWEIKYQIEGREVRFRYRFVPGVGYGQEFDDAAADQLQAALEEHQANIQYARKAIAGYQRDLAAATDETSADRIRFNILHMEQDIHDSQDLIASLKTGQIVHTRGPWERHAEAVAVQNSLRLSDKLDRAHQMQASALRMTAILRQYAPDEARKMHELILKQISTGIFEKDGMAYAQKALDQIHAVTKNYCRQAQLERVENQETAAAIAASTARNVEILESIKRNSDRAIFVGTMLTPMGPGAAISIAYEGATIAVENGPKAAIRQMARDAVAMAALAGVMKGGEFVLGKFLNPKTAVTVEDVFGAARFQNELKMNNALVDRVRETQGALNRARKAGIAAEDLVKLETAATDAVSAANSSTLAKRIMKNELYQAQEAAKVATKQAKLTTTNPDALKAAVRTETEAAARLREVEELHAGFQKHVDVLYTKIDAAVVREMQTQGYNAERNWFMEFRNATSKGVNCDRDFGLLSHMEALLQQHGKPADLEKFMAECQKAYEKNYRRFNNGRSARLADQNITTSVHSESFPLEFLDSTKVGTASRASCQRAGKTIYNKVVNALSGPDPEIVNFQKACASLSKDIKTKVFTSLDAAKKSESLTARGHWEEITHVMDDFAKGRIDPLDATRKMRALTGGKTMRQVALDARKLMGTLGR